MLCNIDSSTWTQLNSFRGNKWLISPFWFIDGTQKGTTSLGQNGPGSNGNEGTYIYIYIYIYIYMLYTTGIHNDIRHNSGDTKAHTGKYNTHIHIQLNTNAGENKRWLLFGYKRFISFWLRFFDTRRETQFFRNHTMLTPPPTFGTPRGVLDLNSSLPVEIRKTKLFVSKAESPTLNSVAENSILCLHGLISILNWRLFKILKFSGPSLPGMTSSTFQSHFLFECLL